MSLPAGSRVGPYEITAAIGAGGMGEVFRARDTKLDRDVAIKVLPSAWAQDRDRLARFEREAKLLASLNHPNIAHVYGFESAVLPDGSTAHFLAMEMVEGEDLSARLKSGAIPLDESIAIAKQVAEGLEEAHGNGIIHRDLKPANIRVTAQGKVKILDFGLAKALEGDAGASPANSQLSRSPTISRHMTEAGMILGTAAYMSPEQARGKPLDKRTDVWSFAVILYEILSGRRAFEGDDVTEVLAAVIRDAPDMNALPAKTPEPIRRLLRRCLEKDRHERLADMSAARLEIKDALATAHEAGGRSEASGRKEPQRSGSRASAGLALLSLALVIALAASLATTPGATPSDRGVIRFPLSGKPGIRVANRLTQPFAISRDGSTIVMSATSAQGIHLWARTLDDPEPRLIAETEGGAQPAISPDGEWVAFVTANHVIRKVRIKGGGATTIATLDDSTAAITWGVRDDILFELIGSATGIQQVSANGGTPKTLVPLDTAANETRQRRPFVLRAENRLLFASTDKDGKRALGVFALDDGRRVRLPLEVTQALGMIDDEIVYSRADGALMAAPFDPTGMRVLGPARQLTDRVAATSVGTAVTMSPDGVLVYQPPGAQASRLMLGDPEGRATPLGSWVRVFGDARFSPDGKRVAVGILPGAEGEGLWVIDRATTEATKVAGVEDATLVDWTPDGKALLSLRSARAGEIWTTAVDGSRASTLLVRVKGLVREAALARDGQSLFVARRIDGSNTQDLIRVPLDPSQPPVTVVPSRSAGGSMQPGAPRVSSDGQWVAFMDETVYEVHVRSTSDAGGAQVSDQGGLYPVWGPRSGQLFYGMLGGMVEASLQTSPALTVGKRRRLESWPSSALLFDISSDGKAFLLGQPTADGPQALVALNWGASVRGSRQGR